MANDTDHTDDGLCDILWAEDEGEPWAFYTQTKDGIEFVFSKPVVGLSDSRRPYNAYNLYKENNSSGNPIHFGETLLQYFEV